MKPARRPVSRAITIALGLAVALAATGAASAQNDHQPAIHHPPTAAPLTQAQLADKLRAERPNPFNPHPELQNDRGDPATTPVQPGWNGTAVKGGQSLNIYWDEAGQSGSTPAEGSTTPARDRSRRRSAGSGPR